MAQKTNEKQSKGCNTIYEISYRLGKRLYAKKRAKEKTLQWVVVQLSLYLPFWFYAAVREPKLLIISCIIIIAFNLFLYAHEYNKGYKQAEKIAASEQAQQKESTYQNKF